MLATMLFGALLAAAPGVSIGAGETPPIARIDLSALPWKARPGDDLRWAAPEYDDRDWRAVEVPMGLVEAGLDSSDGFYWYRVELPPLAADSPWALLLGRMCEAEEIYLNGRFIGGEGSLGHRWFDYVSVCRKARFVALPPELLEPEGPNLLAIRVFSLWVDAGIYHGEVAAGPADELLATAVRADRPWEYYDVVKISIVVLLSLFVLGVWLARAGSEGHRWLPGIMAVLTTIYVVESLPFYEAGLRSALVQRLDLIPFALLPVLMMLHSDSTLGRPTRSWQWGLGAVTVLPGFLLQLDMPIARAGIIFSAWMGLALVVLGLTIVRLAGGVRARVPLAGLLLVGVVAGTAGLIGLLVGIGFLGRNLDPFEAGLFALLVAFLAAFVLAYRRDRRDLERLSLGVLQARDAERAHLARELHDGLGQRLVMTRFRLEALDARGKGPDRAPEGRALAEPIEELRESSAELRSIIEGLIPSTLERMGLVAAMRSYGGRWAELSGARLVVWPQGGEIEVTAETRQHLFRIFQEAVHNAVRHGAARHLLVRMRKRDGRLRLEVRDDGIGFDTERRRSGGIGLSTMAQRARLCGGRFALYSRPGRGSRVEVAIPASSGNAE